MTDRLHSSTTLVEGMSGVDFTAGTSRKRDLEVKIQEPRLIFWKVVRVYINFNGCSYDPKILFPTLLTSPEESKARLEKLRRKLSNQAGDSHPTEPTVPGVLVAILTRHIKFEISSL